MPKPTAAWGIDIGQMALKAVRLEVVDGQATATAFDYIEHAKILSQPDADADQLTREALEKFLSRNQLGNDLVAISVPGQSGLARFVKLPPVEPSKIPDIVRFEAKQQIPFPLDEVVWDYQKISGGDIVDKFATDTEIGLFAMKKEVIAKHMGQFNQANVEVHVVQMAPLALCNYATYELLGKGGVTPMEATEDEETPRGKKKCVVVLDVGTDATNLIITDAGKIIWQRPLQLGGNHFTRALVKEMKLTFPKAEHLKRNAAKSPDLASILKALRPVLTDFVGEVQRSLGYFTNTHRDAHVASMVGLGSAFRLPGLQKYMSEKLSLEVKRPTSMDRLQGDGVKSDPVFIDNLLTFPVAYGLALQGLNELGERKDYGRINTNLLPPQLKTERLIRSKKPYAAAAAAALLLGTGVLAYGYGAKYSSVNDKALADSMKKVKEAATRAEAQTKQKADKEKDNRDTEVLVKSIIKGNDNRADMVRLNESVLAFLPRPGEGGNMEAPNEKPYWTEGNGRKALDKMIERIRMGASDVGGVDSDYSESLATVQIESVFVEYTDNLKGFLENADAAYFRKRRVNIGDNLPKDETEEKDVGGKMKRVPVLKAPECGGYVVQISGFTTNHSPKFIEDVLIGNIRNAKSIAEQMTTFVMAPGGKTIADGPMSEAAAKKLMDEKNIAQRKALKKNELAENEKFTVKTKVELFLPDVKTDPIRNRISHVMLLNDAEYYNPQPREFRIINSDYITPLIPQGEAAPATDTTGAAGAAQPAAATVSAVELGWSPFNGMYPWDDKADVINSEKPKEDGKIHPKRREFVIVFLWRDTPPNQP